MDTKYFGQISSNKLMSIIKAAIGLKADKTEVPTKTSQLTNDKGFITGADVPEGAAASTTPPKMDGVQTAGTEMAFARGDHTHPKRDVLLTFNKSAGQWMYPYSKIKEFAETERPVQLMVVTNGGYAPALFPLVSLSDASQTAVFARAIQNGMQKYTVTGSSIQEETVTGPGASATTPKMDGEETAGTESAWARGDHVHPSDTKKLDKAGGTVEGNLTVHGELRFSGNTVLRGGGSGLLELDGEYDTGVKVRNVAVPVSGNDAANKDYVDGKVAGLQTASDVQTAINSALTGVYTPKGTIAFSALPTAAAGNRGWVYNLSDAFTTTAAFADGAGHSYPAGTNVACVDAGGGTYQWDVMAGTYDMSEMTEAEVQAIWDSIS